MNMLLCSFLPLSYHIVKCNKVRFHNLMLADNHLADRPMVLIDKKELRYESTKNLV